MAHWFRARFNLPLNDPRFLSATMDQMAVEYWSDQIAKDPSAADRDAVDEDFSVEEQLAQIDREAAEAARGVDDWENV